MIHRLQDCGLGDLVKGDPLGVGGQCLFAFQILIQVPAYRFALAVRVGGEHHAVGLLRLVSNGPQLLRPVSRHLPMHLEIGIRFDRAILGRQIADMAIRGQHPVVAAQIFLDGFGLGR